MVYVYAPEADFLMPYFKREITLGDENSPIAVMISSTDVYRPLDGWADEESGIDADSVWAKRDLRKSSQTPRCVMAQKHIYCGVRLLSALA